MYKVKLQTLDRFSYENVYIRVFKKLIRFAMLYM